MKNKRFGLLLILAFAALASSCGTSGTYASMTYDDGIYYRPSKEQRAKMIAERDAERERAAQRKYDQYLAHDEEGNLYVVTELMDGETYESRLHKFDSPWYTNPYWYNTWNYAWYNSWYGYPYYTYGYPYYGYYGYYGPYGPYGPYWSGRWYYDPWFWGAGTYATVYGWNYYYGRYGHYGPRYWHDHIAPGPGPGSHGRNVVYTPRSNGSGMYRTTGTATGSRGMYTTRRSTSGGSISTNSTTGTVRASGGTRPTRSGSGSYSSSSSGSYTRSSGGSYSGGGGGGGYRSSGGSSGGGAHTSSGGSHSGGGRR